MTQRRRRGPGEPPSSRRWPRWTRIRAAALCVSRLSGHLGEAELATNARVGVADRWAQGVALESSVQLRQGLSIGARDLLLLAGPRRNSGRGSASRASAGRPTMAYRAGAVGNPRGCGFGTLIVVTLLSPGRQQTHSHGRRRSRRAADDCFPRPCLTGDTALRVR
jgi:hypothetical protein